MDIQPGPEKQHPYIKKSIPVKFNILHRTLTTCAQRYKTLQETVTFTKREKKSISYSDLEAALEKIEKKKKKLLFSRNGELYVYKEYALASQGNC